MIASIDINAIINFVLARRKTTGGFAATPLLPPTVEDTFHAISILHFLEQLTSFQGLLEDCRGDPRLREYLDRLRQAGRLGPKTRFQLLKTFSILNLPLDLESVRRLVMKQIERGSTMTGYYYTVRIVSEVLHDDPRDIINRDAIRAARPAKSTAEEMMMYLELGLAVHAEAADSLFAGLKDWFRKCQNPDGGFGFCPGTTSFIENCHFCLKALSLLGAAPPDPKGAEAFIAGCQSGGGFARNNRSAPFLDATWHAVASLLLFNQAGRA